MAPKGIYLALHMISLILHFSWTWMGLLFSEDENDLWTLPKLREEMDKKRICMEFEGIQST
jgi:hypothetical protein